MSKRVNLNYEKVPSQQVQRKIFRISELSGNFDERYILSSSFSEQKIDSPLVLSASNLKINSILSAYSSHLILSSSAGSRVVLSGTVIITPDISGGVTPADGPGEPAASLKVGRVNGRWGVVVEGSGTTQADVLLYVSGGTSNSKMIQQTVSNDGFYRMRGLSDTASTVTVNVLTVDMPNSRIGLGKGLTSPLVDLHVSSSFFRLSHGALDLELSPQSGSLRFADGHLILTSSAGSTVVVSGGLAFPTTHLNYHVRSVNSHLILSASAGSVVTISGNLRVSGSVTGSQFFDGTDLTKKIDLTNTTMTNTNASVVASGGFSFGVNSRSATNGGASKALVFRHYANTSAAGTPTIFETAAWEFRRTGTATFLATYKGGAVKGNEWHRTRSGSVEEYKANYFQTTQSGSTVAIDLGLASGSLDIWLGTAFSTGDFAHIYLNRFASGNDTFFDGYIITSVID